jgi:hypothetical protein
MNLLPNSLQQPHITVFDELYADRLAALPLEVIITYLVQIVPPQVLPHLAETFDMLGYNGYGLATTDQQRRDVILGAIELHRLKGTPYSIRRALELFGYPNATFDEGVGTAIRYDGTYTYSGIIQYNAGGGHWALFDVIFNAASFQTLPAFDVDLIRNVVEAYKPARCTLRNITVSLALEDSLAAADELALDADLSLQDQLPNLYDGASQYDGSIRHDSYQESVTIV